MSRPPIDLTPPPWRVALPRIALKLAVLVVVILALKWVLELTYAQIETLDIAGQARAKFWIILIGLTLYALIIAIPFVPAVEIAIALIVMEGAAMAPFIYMATVAGLFLAFCIGNRVPVDWVITVLRDMRMIKAGTFLQGIKGEAKPARLATLEARLPRLIAPVLTRYRYVTLALLLSIPGNAAIGGGGGIMMTAGFSRLFSTAGVLLTLLIGVAPVPLIVWIYGSGLLG